MLGRIIAEHAIAVNAATTASTAAVHITRRYASTTDYARPDADALPNAKFAATATRPPSCAAADAQRKTSGPA